MTAIGEHAFAYCTRLTSATIGNSVTSIGSYAFEYCFGLISITIPNSVKSIGKEAFYSCSGLTSATIGNSVTSISSDAFEGCIIKKLIWLTNTPPSGYGNISAQQKYASNNLFGSNVLVYPFLSSMFEVDGIKYVPVSPSDRTCDAIDCSYNTNATNIIINNTVTYNGIDLKVERIQPYTCYNNKFVKNINIKYIGDVGSHAFYGCSSVETISLDNVTSIGQSAFTDCSSTQSITLDNVTSIGQNAFTDCSSTQTITLDNVTSIGQSAFRNCKNLTSITLPNSVTSLGSYAFRDCSAMEYANIGTGVPAIQYQTFYGCGSMKNISIPANVQSIGDDAFYSCYSLTNITIEDRETELSLGSNGSSPLFSSCPLKTVYIGGNISYSTDSSYGYSPFYRNTSLETVVITDKETEISENEFYGCSSLKNVTMGDGVTTIGNWAFSGCSALDYFEFGSGLQSIGNEAFSDCTACTKLISHAATPPVCGIQALDDINKWTCTLYVPTESIDMYKAADQWKEFFFIKETGISDIQSDEVEVNVADGKVNISGVADGTLVEIYDMNGRCICRTKDNIITGLPCGIYIIKAGKTQKKVAL